LFKQAIAPSFTDRTLPPGGPQAGAGLRFAPIVRRHSRGQVTIEIMIATGEYVAVHMRFAGHFIGIFGKVQGKRKVISFIATDLVKVENGRITGLGISRSI
jgi:predicted ester cyclase